MPNNPFRGKKGYQPVSGALRRVYRKDNAQQQRAALPSVQNKELGSVNGTPSPVSAGRLGDGVDDYIPEDQGRYYG